MLVALPVGIYAATRPYSIFDQIASTFALIGFSLPTFFTGIVFILLFSVHSTGCRSSTALTCPPPGLPGGGRIPPIDHAGRRARPVPRRHLDRFVRSAVLDVIRLDYVTTARSKGLAESDVVMKHIVRNALIPVVTLMALQMPIVFGGAIVTEQIFRVPGIGSLLISAMQANDTPVIMAVTFVFACLVVMFNLIADLLYGWLDPRISYH